MRVRAGAEAFRGDRAMANEYGDHLDFRGGRFAGPFTAKAEYHEHGPAPTALDALPARAVGFTGRGPELRALIDALGPNAAGGSETVVVAAVSGLGGIGKTALAVEAGHGVCELGSFPGGVLFLDLHGYDDDPVTADQALEAVLRALGTEPEYIPARADERAALYRSTLAERARDRGPVLILADNASSPAQVRPLFPGGAGHRLLVTSRDRLSQLGARLLALDELTAEEAHELLDRALRIADPADARALECGDAVAELAALCGHLPLALQIAAALLVADPAKPVAELAARLTECRDRLDHLDDGERSVRAAFDVSYRRLPPEQARLLRLLALAPGPDASDETVAALVGAATPPLRPLEALVRAHLVERGRGRRRWHLHDLVRAYGLGVVAGDTGLAEEGEAARERVLAQYSLSASAANVRLQEPPGSPAPERLASRTEALAWLDEERAGLVAAVGWAEEERHAHTAVKLAEYLAEYLAWGRHFDDWIAVGRAAQKAAHRSGDVKAEGIAWNNLGGALWKSGRLMEAIEANTRARDLFQVLGDRRFEAIARDNLGSALREAGRLAEAIEAHTRARDLFRDVESRRDEGIAWNNLGLALREAGRLPEAIEAHTRARDLQRVTGDRHREARASNNLGLDLGRAGRVAEASDSYGDALEIYRELGDWYGMGQALHNLAFACKADGRPSQARTRCLQAAEAFAQAGATAEAAQVRSDAEGMADIS
ncbi:tetratricopeptide repeat protein [Streptomyces phaeochromogenes]|uniref:tetratricopeptide repeat protein n=1 Tax=Streptomyces phaeochromogenes TaxID=1923 RepID=UPI0036B7C63D